MRRFFDIDRLTEVWEALSRNRSRSLLTGFGVFWGIFMLLSLMGGGQGLKTREAVYEFRLAVAVDTGDTDDLARANVEADVIDSHLGASLGGDGHVLHLQNYISGMRGSLVNFEADIAADHHAAQLFLAGVLDLDCTDVFAAAQY